MFHIRGGRQEDGWRHPWFSLWSHFTARWNCSLSARSGCWCRYCSPFGIFRFERGVAERWCDSFRVSLMGCGFDSKWYCLSIRSCVKFCITSRKCIVSLPFHYFRFVRSQLSQRVRSGLLSSRMWLLILEALCYMIWVTYQCISWSPGILQTPCPSEGIHCHLLEQ